MIITALPHPLSDHKKIRYTNMGILSCKTDAPNHSTALPTMFDFQAIIDENFIIQL